MIYEVRTYNLKTGAVSEFEKRMEAAMPNRSKYSELAACWHTDLGPLSQVVYIWPYENFKHRAEKNAQAAKESNWPPDMADIIISMEANIFTPFPLSPKLGGGQKLGSVYEMRIDQYQVGSMPTVFERWTTALEGGRLELSHLAACMSSKIGMLNVWVHIWPYVDLDERERVRAESQKLSTWPPSTKEFLVSQETKILIPASFSPTA